VNVVNRGKREAEEGGKAKEGFANHQDRDKGRNGSKPGRTEQGGARARANPGKRDARFGNNVSKNRMYHSRGVEPPHFRKRASTESSRPARGPCDDFPATGITGRRGTAHRKEGRPGSQKKIRGLSSCRKRIVLRVTTDGTASREGSVGSKKHV